MAYVETQPRSAGLLARAPSGGLVLGAIASVQFGAALATHLFDQLGPAGTVLLRVATASVILVAIWTPRVRGRPRSELVLAAVFGLVLAGMNLAFYESIDRIPLGTAVTIEFVGPLAVAVIGSRRPLDLLWVALALAGILALTQGGTHSLDGLGVALALIAGCLWGAYIILNGRVGRAYERGHGVTPDLGRALQLYQQACTAKDAWGCGYLGQAYATGRGVAKDAARGSALLKQACDGGVSWACNRIARP